MTEQINARSTAMKKVKDRDVKLKGVCRTNGRQPGVILSVATVMVSVAFVLVQ